MRALLLNAEDKLATVQTIPRPAPRDGELLIRIEAVALNPVDSLYVLSPLGETGRTVGSDFAGTVVESNSTTHQVGQRAAGFPQGACSVNDRPGAFAEYLVCPADLTWPVPDSVALEEAAAVSLCALTAAQGLHHRLGMRSPFRWTSAEADAPDVKSRRDGPAAPFSVFIYGASTSVGMYAAQLVGRSAEVSGVAAKLIWAASRARFPLLQAEPYSYDVLVDYRDPGWPDEGVDFVYGCISEDATVKPASGLRMGIVRSREGGLSWLSGGCRLFPNPVRRMPGSLERIVPDGFALLGSGSMQDRAQHGGEPYIKPVSAE
ncbi:chaperonin 10-like protein [Colletotrichum cereale]|nr:chaperonin 10-like protein [Colletotrichum cereale]